MQVDRSANPLFIPGVLAGPIFIVGYTILDLTRDGFDPMRRQISELALGEGGWQMGLVFIVAGALMVIFGVGLLGALRPSRLLPVLMVICGVAFIVAAFFPTAPTIGPVGGWSSTSGVHDVASGIFYLSLATAAIASGVRHLRNRQRALGVYSIASVVAMVVLLAISSIGFARVPGFLDVSGLFERLSVMSGLIWMTVLAARGTDLVQ